MSNDYCFQDEQSFIQCPMIIIFPMLSPSTREMLLQTKSAGLARKLCGLIASLELAL
jgi:hypothetical protein